MFRDPSTPVVKQLFSEHGDLPDLQDYSMANEASNRRKDLVLCSAM